MNKKSRALTAAQVEKLFGLDFFKLRQTLPQSPTVEPQKRKNVSRKYN
jgi:hypothetical protein